MRLIDWTDGKAIPQRGEGMRGAAIKAHLDLCRLHGETEFVRRAFVGDFDEDGRPEILTRTLNANRVRAMRLADGETLWTSPDLYPPPEQSSQISQLGLGDIDGDGAAECVLATYEGHVVCIRAADGGVAWKRKLPWHINNPRLLDWDGDGRPEVVTGSLGRDRFNPEGAHGCSMQVMRLDGTPLYQHCWEGEDACGPLAVGDFDGDGRDEALVAVGTHGGPEGRFSLAEGHKMHLFLVGCP
jgi:hypothetical protein